ncbi:MAG TPA: cupin domain-containing protein [Bryobacteraceae bacterium]|nr:cupin domain-containing protein [Bryobacteraceae bacterium]
MIRTLVVLLVCGLSAELQAQQQPVGVRVLMTQALDDGYKQESLIQLNIGPALVAPAHMHMGAVFAYIAEGNIENQVDPDPVKTYHPGDFFWEPPMHVHRMLKNLSTTEGAKIVVFQMGDTGKANAAVKTLIQEPLEKSNNLEATMLILDVAPGGVSTAHKHPGPVIGYILQGAIENQVDPDPPKTYHVGDYFYEPPLHVHRVLRNLSKTDPAKVLVFQIGEKGAPGVLSADTSEKH